MINIKRIIKFFKWIKVEAMKPMTQHQFDSARAMSGGKKCPYCGEWL